MKKVWTVFWGMMLVAGAASASPLTDYSAGSAAIDLDWRNAKMDGSYTLNDFGFTASVPQLYLDRKYSLDAGLTVGLGNNFALQYNDFRPSGTGTAHATIYIIGFPPVGDTVRLRAKLFTQQYNLLYKMDENFAVFTGLFHAKGKFNGRLDFLDSNIHGEAKQDIWQFGLVGSTPLGDKTTLYGSVGVGRDLTNWTVGLSHEIMPRTELNLSYRQIKVKDLNTGANGRLEGEAKGFGLGLTHKF